VVEVTTDLLNEIIRRIVAIAHPEKIILFGSRARGQARPTSDLDILVIAKTAEPNHRRSVPLYGALSGIPLDVDVDILVYTPEEVSDWSQVRQAFPTTAIREGKVLYEKQS
jgi:predicted nucleotidyltransferase